MWDTAFWVLIVAGVIFLIYDIWAMWSAGVSKTGFVLGVTLMAILSGIFASTLALKYEWTMLCWWSMLPIFIIANIIWKIIHKKRLRKKYGGI